MKAMRQFRYEVSPHLLYSMRTLGPGAQSWGRPVGGPNCRRKRNPAAPVPLRMRVDIPTAEVKNSRGTEKQGMRFYRIVTPDRARGEGL